jgi:uncharacterized membrane protein YgcG
MRHGDAQGFGSARGMALSAAGRIAVGVGLESALPDAEADRLGPEMVPMLKTGDYGEALLQLAKRIQLEIAAKVE